MPKRDLTTEIHGMLDALSSLRGTRSDRSMVALAQYKDMPKLKKPDDYHEKIKLLQGYYFKDPLFGSLIDMNIHFATDGHDWEVISRKDERLSLDKLKSAEVKQKTDSEREEEVWRAWDRKLNGPLVNVYRGSEFVDDWIMWNTQITGMCALTWKYGNVSVSDDQRTRDYKMPVIMVDWPSQSVLLRKGKSWEDPEEFYTKKPDDNTNKTRKEKDSIPGAEIESPDVSLKNYIFHDPIGRPGSEYGSFVIRYKWSPGSVSMQDKTGEFSTHLGLYPNPPHESCIPWLMMRESLWSSDLQILDGIINFILAWFIGSKEYQLKPKRTDKSGTVVYDGDFAQAKKLLEEYGAKKVLEMFLPHWVKPEVIVPPTDTLLNAEKYIQATIELLSAFGILPSGKSEVGTLGIEQKILYYRNKVLLPFWDMLCEDIVSRNPGALTTIPNRRYNPLPFSRETIMVGVQKAHEQGELSTETYFRFMGIDPTVERARVKKEFARGDRGLYDEMVPTRFKQDVVKGDETETKKNSQAPGRPEGTKDTVPRTAPK